ncbi:MAG: SdrD B-like domain-containing protein [Caldilineaceae bacterium]
MSVTVVLYDGVTNTPVLTTTTDAAGFYSFTDLTPGDYYVAFTAPDGYILSPQDADDGNANADERDSDADPTTAQTATTMLTSGENDPTWDAGLYAAAAIGDYVWYDDNADGVQDAGETGVVSVTVELLDSTGAVIGTTETDASGYYSFTNLIPDDYSIRFVLSSLPAGYLVSPQDQGDQTSEGVSDSDADVNTGDTTQTTLDSGEYDPTWDMGIYQLASLGDYVWHDVNGNGIQDGGETGVVSVTVELLDSAGTVIDTTETDATGYYNFTELVPGAYSVRFTPPAGYVLSPQDQGDQTNDGVTDSDADPTTGETVQTTLTSGENDPTWDAGLYQPAAIGDYIWYDENADGVQDAGETGVVSVTVELLDSAGLVIGTTETDVTGFYNFTNLAPGDYSVRFNLATLPAGYVVSPQDQGDQTNEGVSDSDADVTSGATVVTTLLSGEYDPTWDMGIYQPASLGDLVWDDLNSDGVQDEGEPGVPGVPVELYDSSDTLISTTVTLGDGSYGFTNLVPGDYYVIFTPPAGYTISPQDVDDGNANPDERDSDADPTTGRTTTTTLTSGENDPTWDAGLYRNLVAIGNRVWLDQGAGANTDNGLLDGDEQGADNVTVELYRAGDVPGTNAPLATTTTANGGYYLFDNLAAGDYFVHVPASNFTAGAPLAGYRSSTGAGSDETTDQDVDENGDDDESDGVSSQVYSLQPNSEQTEEGQSNYTGVLDDDNVNFTADFGFVPTLSLGNLVFADYRNNGIYEPTRNDYGIDGVTVLLYRDVDGSGDLTAGDGAPIMSTTTSGGGFYLFSNLEPGDYVVELPASNFAANTPLANFISSLASVIRDRDVIVDPDNNVDNNDDGVQQRNPNSISSLAITLEWNSEPVNDGDANSQSNLTVDFGLYDPAIGDQVWQDIDGDGLYEPGDGEAGLEGVLVNLYEDSNGNGMWDAGDTLVMTTTTDVDGEYIFSFLPPTDYIVQIPASNMQPGGPLAGLVNSVGDSDPDNDIDHDDNGIPEGPGIANVTSLPVTITSGGEPTDDGDGSEFTNLTIDFGFHAPLSLGNLVWLDANNNGVVDAGESGIANVTVNLYRDINNDGTPDGGIFASTTTGADGLYLFTGLSAESYIVEIVTPAGYQSSTGNSSEPAPDADADADDNDDNGTTAGAVIRSASVTLALNSEPTGENPNNDAVTPDANTNLTVDFGLFALASLGDLVWHDLNADGVQDAGEPGVAGVVVELYSSADVLISTTVTAADGSYGFSNLLPGDYYVDFTPPPGYLPSPQDQGGDDALDSDMNPDTGRTTVTTLTAGENDPTWDAGLWTLEPIELAALGDFVWRDLDADGVQDAGEPGVEGVTVELYDGAGTLVDTTTTDVNGQYSFTNLEPGDYYVVFTPPAGFRLSPQDQGADDAADSDANPATGRTVTTTLSAGETDVTWDAGLSRGAAIGNYVWLDADGNGVQDAGEEPISNVTVQLFDGNGNLVATTTTDANGLYGFSELTPGDYYVQFTAPDGLILTQPNQGADDALDSDAALSTLRTEVTTLDDGESDPSWDAGFTLPASLGNYVWDDGPEATADGIKSPDEPGIPGVTVILWRGWQ